MTEDFNVDEHIGSPGSKHTFFFFLNVYLRHRQSTVSEELRRNSDQNDVLKFYRTYTPEWSGMADYS